MADAAMPPFVEEMAEIAALMYTQGWDERNGGNISLFLDEGELEEYVDLGHPKRMFETGFTQEGLDGKYFLVTGAGKYFKNVQKDPEANLGLVRIADKGQAAQLIWGFKDGGRPTSELAAHLISHVVRWSVDADHRVVMHCHPTNLLAMTFVHDLDEREFTRTLWQMCTECLMVFPDGVGVLPWMVCGTEDIGRATAEKMKESRLVVWANHGIYGVGNTLDAAFGLIETAEKAAEVYMKIAHLPRVNTIDDKMLHDLAAHLKITPRKGYLN